MDSRASIPDHDLIDAARKTADQLASVLGASMPVADLFPGYDLVRQIGRGGQGVVYEATQRATKRRVAIKAMRGGAFITPRERARFQREVEFAARLQHPNIVSVLDSGIHQGHDFFVMEYVEGPRIDQAEIPGNCPVRETLGLIASVCDVVDYAHQHGVLHRDLKPSNVLIDERGQPHILDFGLAKAMDPASSSAGGMSISEPGQILGTLGYMSPEQSRGQFEQMSVRSDVYSLGAMTYQLLTGALPCRLDGGLNDILERIAHQDPARPSSIRRKLDADIDAILLKALDKSPANRYPTAGEFAADIRRFLADEPIQARRMGLPTRIVRWTRRHRAVAALSAVVILMAVATTVNVFLRLQAQALQAQEKALQLQEEAKKSGLVSGFLKDILVLFDPNKTGSARTMLIQTLDNRAQMVGELLSVNPAAEAEVRNTLGELYTNLSLFPKAEEQLRRALAVRQGLYGDKHLEVAQTQRNLGFVLKETNRLPEAEALYRQDLSTLRELLDPDDDQIAYDLTYLGGLLLAKRDYDEAQRVLNESLEIRRRHLPEDHRKIAIVKNMLALVRLDEGDHVGAEQLFRDVLLVYRRDLSETEPLRVATCLNNLADCLRRRAQFVEAETDCREGLEIRRKTLPGDHVEVAGSLLVLGRIMAQKGDLPAAQEALKRCLEIRQAKYPKGHPKTAVAQSALGECLTRLGQFAEAEPLLVSSYETLEAARGRQFPETADALRRIIDLYTAWGQPDKAAEYQAKSPPATRLGEQDGPKTAK